MPTAQQVFIVSFNSIFTYVIVKYCQGNKAKEVLLGFFKFYFNRDKQEGKTGIESPSM